MRTIFFVRHAKSSWDDATMRDFDRPLNERGKRDAIFMAQHLFDQKLPIDAFISSPAKRARKTASYFMKQYATDVLIEVPGLYLPGPEAFDRTIEAVDNQYKAIAIFSHNPGITDYVNGLTNAVRVDNVPTCGIFAVRTAAIHWTDFSKTAKEFLFFDYPSKYRNDGKYTFD